MMIRKAKLAVFAAVFTVGVGVSASYASAATNRALAAAPRTALVVRSFPGFTPAAADPRLAAAFSRGTTVSQGFRFTPAPSARGARKVTVAVRARSSAPGMAADRSGNASALGIAPVAYNLGVSVGWRRFAISGDIGEADMGLVGGRRQATDLGLSYTVKRWTTRVQLAAERPVGTAPRIVDSSESVALDVGGSYSLTRNFALTAGVRYKSEREKFESRSDTRRDSQAVYLGTAFRF
ncbi:MAG: hypothetical protein ACKOAN_02250 [Chakrabartia sp.]|jgi:hypothetical protein